MTEPDNDPVAALLDGLRPAAPSDELMRRLSAARPVLRMPSLKDKVILFIPRIATVAALLALASALAYKFLPRGGQGSTAGGGQDTLAINNRTSAGPGLNATPVAEMVPLQTRQRLLGVQDLGMTRDDQQGAVRLMRARWLDDQTFSAGSGVPPVRQERLRDEIVPVAVSTF